MDKKPDAINIGMTILIINTGTSANAGDGDSLRTAFNKINANFEYLSTATGAVNTGGGSTNLGDIIVNNATISTVNTNEDIIFDPNGSGTVRLRSTTLQYDNGFGGNPGQAYQILQTRGSGTPVGLAIDGTNSSLRVVGDTQLLGTLADFGLYNGALGAWASKFYIDYQGNVTAQGSLSVAGDITLTRNLSVNQNLSINQNVTAHGAVTATGMISALGGVKFSDGTTLQTAVSALTVGLVTTGTNTVYSSTMTNVSTLVFDTDAGFSLLPLSTGTMMVGMNSTFKYWHVAGQDTLVAEGLDHIEFVAGSGVTIETNTATTIKSITFKATSVYGGNLGDLVVDSTALYPNAPSRNVSIGNANVNSSTNGVSFVVIPAKDDLVSPLIISSPNEVRLTTDFDSPVPITVAPNQDGTGPGYVVIGSSNSTSTAGMFAFSAAAEINFWPNQDIAQLYSGPDTGALDLSTTGNNNISIRPGGTGTVTITGPTTIQKGIVLGTESPGAGADGSVNTLTYKLLATQLDPTVPVHIVGNGHYYLPQGVEGQMTYFIPATGVIIDQSFIWFEKVRTLNNAFTPSVVVYSDQKWSVVSSLIPQAPLVAMAIFTDGAWNTRQLG